MSRGKTVYGVDFSGAKLAGRNIWIAEARASSNPDRLELVALNCLESLCGTPERDPALAWLVSAISDSSDALWSIDFPFGLPIELFDAGTRWKQQLEGTALWKSGAHDFGLWCVGRAKRIGDKLHIRRSTDSETRTPFDCYHYRIIYQTFHGMRDVLLPLRKSRHATILPFDKLSADRSKPVVMEACPGSTLKRLALPHNNYKQPAGGPLEPRRLRNRRTIVDAMKRHIRISEIHRRLMMRNPGGDALDAVIAAVGTWQSWNSTDHRAVARHVRYPHEGRIYA